MYIVVVVAIVNVIVIITVVAATFIILAESSVGGRIRCFLMFGLGSHRTGFMVVSSVSFCVSSGALNNAFCWFVFSLFRFSFSSLFNLTFVGRFLFL